MDTSRKKIDAARQTPESKKVWNSFAGEVAMSLLPGLEGSKAEAVIRAVGIAEDLAAAARLKPEFKDMDNPGNWEKTVLLLAISHALNIGLVKDADVGLALISNLYSRNQVEANISAERPLLKGTRQLIFQDFLRRAGLLTGEIKPNEEARIRQKFDSDVLVAEEIARIRVQRSLVEYVQRTGEKVIRLPFKYQQAMEYAQQTQSQYVTDPVSRFSGVAVSFTFPDGNQGKVAFVFQDTSKKTERHERTHLEYPGLRINKLFYSINEGITERETRRQSTIAEKLYGFVFESSYDAEVEFIDLLDKMGIGHLLMQRYTDGATDLKQIKKIYLELINKIGLTGLILLAQAYPQTSNTGRQWFSKNGLRSTEEVMKLFLAKMK